MDRVGLEAATGDQPRDDGIRVPHVACMQVVAPPDRSREIRRECKQPARPLRVIGQAARALYSLRDIRDEAIAPEPQLITEDPQPAGPATPNGAFGYDAALAAAVRPSDRCRLDHEAPLRYPDLERRVIQIACATASDPSRDPFVDAPVPVNEVPSGAERQPVQIDAHG